MDSLLANVDDFPFIYRSVYTIYDMAKTAARDIHGRCQSRRGWGGGSILKQTPIIYLAFEKNPSPFIYLISQKVDLFIY